VAESWHPARLFALGLVHAEWRMPIGIILANPSRIRGAANPGPGPEPTSGTQLEPYGCQCRFDVAYQRIDLAGGLIDLLLGRGVAPTNRADSG
jgi:hypothetical protein